MDAVRKVLVYAVISIGLFVAAVFLEAWIRKTQVADMTIRGTPIEGAQVSGSFMPDLFWMGRSWWIEIESEKPVLLSLDEWSGRIPAGDHKVFSNHDHTNTGDYSDREFWGFPESVTVQELKPERDSRVSTEDRLSGHVVGGEMTIVRLSQYLLNLSYRDLMRLLTSDRMDRWPREPRFYVFLTQRLFPNPDGENAHLPPEICKPCDEPVAEQHLSELIQWLELTSLDELPEIDAPQLLLLDEIRDRETPAELRDWADAIETRSRFVNVLRELLSRNGCTFDALLLIAEQGSQYPDTYHSEPGNALAAICCHLRVGATIPMPEQTLFDMLQRYAKVPHLRHNADNCIGDIIDRCPYLGDQN